MSELARVDNGYTYADLEKWDNDTRYELIDGVAYAMAPPLRKHGDVCGEIFGQLWLFLKGKPCKVYKEDLGVRLNAAGDDDDTVLIPDITVVCDESKLDDKGCNGAPDMVVEVLSPSTASRDKLLKFNKYLRAGVREYWIVDPDSKMVTVNILDNGRYYNVAYGETDTVPVHVLEGCVIDMSAVFAV